VIWPVSPPARDRFVTARRPARPLHDPKKLQGIALDEEPDAAGVRHNVATFFLTSRECPWRCAMCDLWQYTTVEDTPAGAIPRQVADACRELDDGGLAPAHVKLYNAGSFFDPRAVPESDYGAIAQLLRRFSHVIVESHPSLIGARVDRLTAVLQSTLEVAMGLETAHPEALAMLHKRMDLPLFQRAAGELRDRRIALRVFVLVSPPFIAPDQQDVWLLRSIDAALEAGASVISLIPTRTGNGTMEALEADSLFRAPTAADVERSTALARAHVGDAARVFVDPWNGTGLATVTA
jgi:archaeosine synthase beta-subunit